LLLFFSVKLKVGSQAASNKDSNECAIRLFEAYSGVLKTMFYLHPPSTYCAPSETIIYKKISSLEFAFHFTYILINFNLCYGSKRFTSKNLVCACVTHQIFDTKKLIIASKNINN
jgi:hypothetical protein